MVSTSSKFRRRVGVAAFVLVVVAILLLNPREDPRRLDLPPVGEVSAQFVGTDPVFVVALYNGDTLVLDAVSPHRPAAMAKVLVWCEVNERFVDLLHGSAFDRFGDYLYGPSPTGLPRYRILEQGEHHVVVGEAHEGPDRRFKDPRFRDGVDAPVLPDCDLGSFAWNRQTEPTEHDPALLDQWVLHDPGPDVRDLYWFATPERFLGIG